MKKICINLIEYILNNIINVIPFWYIRKLFYVIFGMKIGKDSKILMRTEVFAPWNIEIKNSVIINEKCLLDGRGGLVIGNNSSISRGVVIYTGTHQPNNFMYCKKAVNIGELCWICVNVVILPGADIGKGSIIGANAVASGKKYPSNGVYVGVPAVFLHERDITSEYSPGNWSPIFK